MPRSLASLEVRRTELLRSIGGLRDMRPGSIVAPCGAVVNRIVIALAPMTPVTALTCG